MSPKKRADKSQQLSMSFEASDKAASEAKVEKKSKASKGPSHSQQELFAGLLNDSGDDAESIDSAEDEEASTALVPIIGAPLGFLETETVNAWVAMAGLSAHTQRAYRRWIASYLADVNKID